MHFTRVCATHSSRNVQLSKPATPPTHDGDDSSFRPTVSPQRRQQHTTTTDGRSLHSMPSLEAIRHKMMSSRRIGSALPDDLNQSPNFINGKKLAEQRNFNPNIPCTLGLIVTEVVANSSLRANVEGALDITFPFTSDLPVSRTNKFNLYVQF